MDDVADDIAWQAVATPSLDASGALDVLVDVLLERAVIRPPWPASVRWRNERARARDGTRAHAHLRQQAWEWARRVTRRPRTMFEELTQLKDLYDAGAISKEQFHHLLGVRDT